LPHRDRAVADGHFFSKVFAFAVGGLAVDGDGVGGKAQTHHVHRAGNVAAGVLVQAVGRVAGIPKVDSVLVTTSLREGAVADVVKTILELLARYRRLVGPVFAAGTDLAQ